MGEDDMIKTETSKDDYEGEDRNSSELVGEKKKGKARNPETEKMEEFIERLDDFTLKKTGEKRFKGRCTLCGKEARMDEVKVHIKKHHGDKIFGQTQSTNTSLVSEAL